MSNPAEVKVSICNRALSVARQGKTISNIDEQTNLARLCRTYWVESVREALGSSDWSFSTKTTRLAPVDERNSIPRDERHASGYQCDDHHDHHHEHHHGHPDNRDYFRHHHHRLIDKKGYKFAYAVPSDSIVILGVYTDWGMVRMKRPIPFPEVVITEDNQMYLVSDLPHLIVRYAQYNESYDYWSTSFREYLAHCLALRIAEALDMSSQKIQELIQLKEMALSKAASQMSTEKDNKDVSKDRRYINARR